MNPNEPDNNHLPQSNELGNQPAPPVVSATSPVTQSQLTVNNSSGPSVVASILASAAAEPPPVVPSLKTKKRRLSIILAVVAFVIIGALVSFFIFRPGSNSASDQQTMQDLNTITKALVDYNKDIIFPSSLSSLKLTGLHNKTTSYKYTQNNNDIDSFQYAMEQHPYSGFTLCATFHAKGLNVIDARKGIGLYPDVFKYHRASMQCYEYGIAEQHVNNEHMLPVLTAGETQALNNSIPKEPAPTVTTDNNISDDVTPAINYLQAQAQALSTYNTTPINIVKTCTQSSVVISKTTGKKVYDCSLDINQVTFNVKANATQRNIFVTNFVNLLNKQGFGKNTDNIVTDPYSTYYKQTYDYEVYGNSTLTHDSTSGVKLKVEYDTNPSTTATLNNQSTYEAFVNFNPTDAIPNGFSQQ